MRILMLVLALTGTASIRDVVGNFAVLTLPALSSTSSLGGRGCQSLYVKVYLPVNTSCLFGTVGKDPVYALSKDAPSLRSFSKFRTSAALPLTQKPPVAQSYLNVSAIMRITFAGSRDHALPQNASNL